MVVIFHSKRLTSGGLLLIGVSALVWPLVMGLGDLLDASRSSPRVPFHNSPPRSCTVTVGKPLPPAAGSFLPLSSKRGLFLPTNVGWIYIPRERRSRGIQQWHVCAITPRCPSSHWWSPVNSAWRVPSGSCETGEHKLAYLTLLQR